MVKYVIYQRAKNVMQAGEDGNRYWILASTLDERKFFTKSAMAWCQVQNLGGFFYLKFASKEEAVAYAKNHGLQVQVLEPQKVLRKPKSYNFNFTKDRNLYYY
ncbi:ETC complex I subunit [Candidatus Hepatincola sp. Av]